MKPLHFLIALLLAVTLISSNSKHDYYVSVTKIEYAEEQQSLQIISQIFIDDFEKLLQQRYDDNITLDVDDEPISIESYMERYLMDKLEIGVNGRLESIKFIGKEYKDDITYCYLEIENVSDIKTIEVTNKILFDIFPEQQNIVRLKLLEKNKSFLLIPDNDKCMLNFQ